ncbi:DUF4344 domain-containing metallopeptidase [Falsiruegeria mediterranea]|uniref:Metallopeptidase n=1 Tax=Falsiruegeria mediterranea M17 TaxID=1200281 RepID=A0A2R8C632_9RHOB|nr:DUF4344 domain-containing metallopeptidase [Falsiruegeria mediterranea]SPJ27870.1 hypothetical protein TRM7615_01364 [Falsiruegeria mediterranea M17]
MTRFKFPILATALMASLAAPATAEFSFDADEATQAYVEANLLGIFYHELGHALIDMLELPIFGQEEDAADVLSVFLIDALYEEDSAVDLAYGTAFGFLGEVEQREAENELPAYWDVHGPDLQRYYNLVCIFYGANPDERSDVADELGLPVDRAEYCPDEYDQANHSWGAALDEILTDHPARTIRLGQIEIETDGGDFTAQVIEAEVEALNQDFKLPGNLTVSILPCGEPNAYYDPQAREITMCTEFADNLTAWAPE